MTHFAKQIPAWLLTHLPVRWARHCVFKAETAADSTSNQAPLQLLVDVSVIHQSDARTGIQRVVRALLLQLQDAPPEGYRICPVFATRKHGYCYATSDFLRSSARTTGASNQPVKVKNGDLFLALDLAAHLLPKHQAQLLRWKRAGVQLHVLVYDLLPLLHPEWFNPKTTRNFTRWIRWLAIYANSVICISQSVKIQLHTWLKARFDLAPTALPASTIVLGADIDASAPSVGLPSNSQNLLSRLSSTPTILMVGTLEPRKGYDQVFSAFEELWQQPEPVPALIIVGRPGWKTEELQNKLRNHPEKNIRFFWLDDASDEYLSHLYTLCSGVIVASRAEGFGLPLIEAAKYQKPVLARDIPVLREIQARGISYFQSETATGLANDITHWIVNISSAAPLSTEKHSMPRPPTWQDSATQLLHALNLINRTYELNASGCVQCQTLDNATICGSFIGNA